MGCDICRALEICEKKLSSDESRQTSGQETNSSSDESRQTSEQEVNSLSGEDEQISEQETNNLRLYEEFMKSVDDEYGYYAYFDLDGDELSELLIAKNANSSTGKSFYAIDAAIYSVNNNEVEEVWVCDGNTGIAYSEKLQMLR